MIPLIINKVQNDHNVIASILRDLQHYSCKKPDKATVFNLSMAIQRHIRYITQLPGVISR